jgi:hypothetical protein
MAVHLTRSVVCEGFSEVLYVQLQWMGLMMICCGMAVKKMGMLGVSVKKMETV